MADIYGNIASTAGGTQWRCWIKVWWDAPTTAPTTKVYYQYAIQQLVGQISSDSTHTIRWSDPWGSADLSSQVHISMPAGAQSQNLSAVMSQQHSVAYGTTTPMRFTMYMNGLGAGGSGPSSVDHTLYLPARVPSPPSPPTISYRNLTATSVNLYTTVSGSNNGASADICRYWLLPQGISKDGSYASGVTFTGLTPNTRYEARAQAHNSAGWGVSGPTISFTTPAGVPAKPEPPTTTGITQRTVSLVASAPNNNGSPITKYHWQRATNSTFTANLQGLETTNPSVNMGGFTRATKYWMRIRAANAHGYSEWSNAISFTTLPDRPQVANTHTVEAATRNSVTIGNISVTDTGGESPSDVRIQINTVQSPTGAQVFTRGSWGSVTATGLAADTLHYYRIAVYNSAGWSDYSPWKTATSLSDAPDDMYSPTYSNITDTGFQAHWSEPEMNDSTFEGFWWELSLNMSFSPIIDSGTTGVQEGRLFTDLTPGTEYWLRVRANAYPNNGGWGVSRVKTTGIAPNSGLRIYTFVGGVRRQCEAYTFVGGVRRRLRTMPVLDGEVVTE